MNLRTRYFRSLASSVLCAALLAVATPARAYQMGPFLDGSGPLNHWLHVMPANCLYERPSEAYWVGGALDLDERQFPELEPSFADYKDVMQRTEWDGMESIAASYDPVHRIAAFHAFAKDGDHWYGVIADAPPPPANPKVKYRDLSGLSLGGNVKLGATIAEVATAVGLHDLHPSAAGPACGGYAAEGFCSWNAPSCACPKNDVIPKPDIYATAVFRGGRVAALTWDMFDCRP